MTAGDPGAHEGMAEPEAYLRALATELGRVGVRGGRRRRIVDEFADHLACDPSAELGEPRALAEQFADELGTSHARGAALTAFAALSLAGALLVARLLAMGPFNRVNGSVADTVGLLATVLAAQIAFVSGSLAVVRALRLRRHRTIPAAEARVLVRRAGVALVAGAVATIAIPLRAAAMPGHAGSAGWSVATVAIALAAIALAVPALIRAVRVRPRTPGASEDLLADFGPLRPLVDAIAGHSPTRFALLSGAGLALVVALAGVAAGDPYDGILRGLMEDAVYLGSYALLGRYLGLRAGSPGVRVE